MGQARASRPQPSPCLRGGPARSSSADRSRPAWRSSGAWHPICRINRSTVQRATAMPSRVSCRQTLLDLRREPVIALGALRAPGRPDEPNLLTSSKVWFLTQMCARFSPQQVSHAVERGCGCARARESAVKSSIAQSTAACAGPAFGGGPARRQPVPPQGAEALAFTGRRTMNTRGTRPGLSPMFYRWAEPSLTVQPLGTGRPLAISAVYRGPDFPRACSSSPDTDGVLQPRKSMTIDDNA